MSLYFGINVVGQKGFRMVSGKAAHTIMVKLYLVYVTEVDTN